MAQTIVHNLSGLLSRDRGAQLHFILHDAVFLCGLKQAAGESAAFVITRAAMDAEKIFEARQAIEKTLNGAVATWKILGPEPLAAQVAASLREQKLTVEGVVIRSTPQEVVFTPHEGRIRIADAILERPVKSQLKAVSPARTKSGPIKVLVVDDSKTIQQLLSRIINATSDLTVVAAAEKPSEVEALIQKHNPDVMTLDIHMPERTGTDLIKELWPKYSIPTIMISSISMEESNLVLQALENGAIDYVQKPSFDKLQEVAPMIVDRIRMAAKANIVQARHTPVRAVKNVEMDGHTLIAIGSSTGGTEALKHVLMRLPDSIPPILITQHIPPVFSRAFADRLNGLCRFEVKEATDGDEIRPNRVLIAPGGLQMRVKRHGQFGTVVVDDAPPVNRHKPSVDVLFHSVATEFRDKAIGVILTGMGADGAKGLKAMRDVGARTVAQDEASCVVFGMPREAIQLGAAEEIKDLDEIPQQLIEWLAVSRQRLTGSR